MGLLRRDIGNVAAERKRRPGRRMDHQAACLVVVALHLTVRGTRQPADVDVGRRLALWALAKTYGKDIEYSGPLYQGMKVDGNKVCLSFTPVNFGCQGRKGMKIFDVCYLQSHTWLNH